MDHNCYATRNDREFDLMNKCPDAQDCITDWLVSCSASQVVSHMLIYEMCNGLKWLEMMSDCGLL
jgi:hypothetical protein